MVLFCLKTLLSAAKPSTGAFGLSEKRGVFFPCVASTGTCRCMGMVFGLSILSRVYNFVYARLSKQGLSLS